MNKNINLKNYKCRTCFQATKGLKSLTNLATEEKEPPLSYGEILRQLTNINYMEDKFEEITQLICGGCIRKLKAAYAFVQQAQEINEELFTMLYQDYSCQTRMDCLQDSQVDIEACLEIKMEHEEAVAQFEVPQCDVQIKLEEPEESMLTNIVTAEILDSNIDEVTQDEIDLKSTNLNIYQPSVDKSDEEIINEDLFKIEVNKQSSDISDFEDSNDDSSNDSDWHEHLNSSVQKVVKNTSNTKPDKPGDKTVIEDDIAVPCNECNKIFKNYRALATHQSSSHKREEQKFSCPLCGNKFTQSCAMYKHMRTFHGPETVPLIRKPSSQERPYQCDKCSRNYIKKKHLDVHIRAKHSKENEDNEKEKLTDSSATEDKKAKRYEQPYLCSICGSCFTSKTLLTIHMRRHTGEHPFKCDLCDRAYPRKTELTIHMRLHTGEKPYECKVCGKFFRVSGKLATHMRSHTDIRPYKCTQCERSFKYSKDLNIHVRIHTGERPYCCNVCGSTFTQSNSLKAHRMKLGHMETVV